jgi:hypothetical protein
MPSPGGAIMSGATPRKPAKQRKPARPKRCTRIARGMQWPGETDEQALFNSNLAVALWNGLDRSEIAEVAP